MLKKTKILFFTLLTLTFSAGVLAGENKLIPSAVVSGKAAKTETFEWGQLITYFAGESYSATDSLTAVAVINPGMQIHPPHVHSEEEYLMVLEGEGTWSLLGKDFKATAGDILYAEPWDIHGIKNTGKIPLKFVVIKWNPKPVSPKAEPGK